MFGKTLQIDGGRGDDDFEVRAPWQEDLQIAEQKVDVKTALVGFVDDDRVVALEVTVVLGFGQQYAVGHQLDQGVGITLILKPHLIADQRPQRRTQFFSDPAGNTTRCNPARLGVTDQPVLAAANFEADFRQLSGFTRTGFTGQNQHLMLEQRRLDLVALGGNRQIFVITNQRHAGCSRSDLRA